jgi:hypothetical protein
VFTGRDPFEPLISVSTASTDTGTSATPVVIPSSPEPSPEPSPAPGSGTGSNDGDATIHHGGHVVTLIAVVLDKDEAKVAIDDTKYTATVGQLIVDGFKLVGVHDACADFVHVTHPFTLCLATSTA